MDLTFSEEQVELRSSAHQLLGDRSGPEQVREAMQSALGHDPELWKMIGQELGWTSVHVPEEAGGLGLGYVDLVALLEVTGEYLLCGPFLSTVCLGANALICAATKEQQAEWLPKVAAGEATVTLAVAEAAGSWRAEDVALELRADGDGFVLEGEKHAVLDGAEADRIVVAARTPGSTGLDGLSLVLVDGHSEGLERTPTPGMDQTRRLARLRLSDVRIGADRVLGTPGQAGEALQRTLDLAAIGLAAEQVGGAQRCLDMAVAYAKEREQFGRAIGSFQAIKHKCADMMLKVESARSALYYAACIATDGGEPLGPLASLCKAWCSEAYFHCAAENIQIHGGVGFTWEYDPHLHFKRARASEAFLGTPADHRERVAQILDL